MPVRLHGAVLCIFAAGLSAARAGGQSFELDELLKQLSDKNPKIAAARYRVEAAAKRPSQVRTLPEPRASYTNLGVGHPVSGLNGSSFAYHGFGVSQELPFPGKLALASEEAQREAESERESYLALLNQQTAALKIAWFDWLGAVKAIGLIEQNRDVVGRFEEIARNRYAAGKGLQQDVLKAQLEVSGVERQLLSIRERRDHAEAEIASLLALPSIALAQPATWSPTAMPTRVESLVARASDSPGVRMEQKLVDARATGVNRSLKEFRPDFNVSFQWQHTGSTFPDYYMATAEVKIPLYYSRKQRYAVEESVSRLGEAKQNYRAARQDAEYEVRNQFLIAQSSENILRLYKTTLIPQAALTVDSSTAAYETGSLDFLSALTNVTNLLTLQREYYDELTRHEQAIVRLKAAAGGVE